MGVDPARKLMTSPFGVNTNTSVLSRSIFSDFKNSRESSVSSCQSTIWRSHASCWSSASAEPLPPPSL